VPRAVASEARREGAPEAGRPSILTKRATDVLLRVERLMDDATRALATSREPSKTTDAQGTGIPVLPSPIASSDQQPASNVRGN
jgi:hypothetical protein